MLEREELVQSVITFSCCFVFYLAIILFVFCVLRYGSHGLNIG